jgi:hypothetical protein
MACVLVGPGGKKERKSPAALGPRAAAFAQLTPGEKGGFVGSVVVVVGGVVVAVAAGAEPERIHTTF